MSLLVPELQSRCACLSCILYVHSFSIIPVLAHLWPLPPLAVTVELPPSWLSFSASHSSVPYVPPPHPLCSLSSLLLCISAAVIFLLKLCRCVCGYVYLPHTPSALSKTHLINQIKSLAVSWPSFSSRLVCCCNCLVSFLLHLVVMCSLPFPL